MCCHLQPKTLRYSNGCLSVVGMIFVVVILVLSLVSSLGYSSGAVFLEAAMNWNKEVIIDVTSVDPKTGKCEYDNQPFFEYAFKGISAGCDCSTPSETKVSTGACSSSQTTCKTVKTVDKQTFSNWADNNDKPIRLCFKRLYDYKYYKKYLMSDKCRDPTKEKMCGGTDPLTAFCVPKSQKCPVQSISTVKVNPTDEQIGTTGLWISRDIPNQNHLSEVAAGESGICQYASDKYIDNISSQYKLLKDKDFTHCKIDDQYKKIQEIDAYDFYKSNNLDADTFPGLVNSKKIGIFQRDYIYWKMECRQGTEFDDLVKIAIDFYGDYSNHQQLYKVSAGTLGFMFAYCLLLMCGCFTTQVPRKCCTFRECCKIDCCCCCCMKKGCTFNGCTIKAPQCIRRRWMRKDGNSSCTDYLFLVDPLHVLLIAIKIILNLVMLALSIVNFAKIKSYKGTLDKLAGKKCSTDLVNDSLSSTNDNLANFVSPLDAVILAIVVVYFILSLYAICIYLSNQVNRRRELIRQKLEMKSVKILEENDQTIPTISSTSNVNIANNNSIQMMNNPLNPANPYPQHQNPYTQQTQQGVYPIGQPTGQYPPIQQQIMYPPQQQIMYPQQQQMMYPQQQQQIIHPPNQQQIMYPPPQQGLPVYYKPN